MEPIPNPPDLWHAAREAVLLLGFVLATIGLPPLAFCTFAFHLFGEPDGPPC